MTEPRTSGADLARVALQAARAAAKQRPLERKAARRRSTSRRTDGRDPIGLGAAITGLMTDRGWEAPTTGGDLIGQWQTMCPNLATTVQPVHYDPDAGRLDLRPVSDAHGAQLRLRARQLTAHLNGKLGREAVREVRVLASGPITPTTATASAAAPAPSTARTPAVDASVRTRDDAHPGYHQTLAAIDHTPPAGQKPRLERDWGTGEYSWLREPEDRFTDAVVALEEAAEANRGNDPEAVRQAARRMARAQKAGRLPATPTTFQRTA